MLDRTPKQTDPERWTAASGAGMVVTSHYLATGAGAEILGAGGSAADAAIAASLALGVVEPAGSGIGGMAMAVIHTSDGATLAFPGPCRCPRSATPEAVAASKRYRGYRAVATPGQPALLDALHTRYGRLNLRLLVEPAIRLANDGYPITPLQEQLIRRYARVLGRRSAGSLFLESGRPLAEGSILRQPILAGTLARLAEAGFRDFYRGAIARSIVADMEAADGFVGAADLAAYPEPEPVDPISARFGDIDVRTMPPPGGGAALVQMLNMFEAAAGPDFDADTPEGTALLASLIRLARTDRLRFRLKTGPDSLGGAACLVDAAWASRRVQSLGEGLREPDGKGETSHLAVADGEGNIVSMTQSLERSFGAAEASPRLGLLYNGFLRAFKVRNRKHPHFLEPDRPARSNACPTILLRDARPWGAIGSTGSERLASGIFQVLVRLRRQSPFAAVLAPRIHATPDGVLMYEDRLDASVLEGLRREGFQPEPHGPYSFRFGGLNLITSEEGRFVGVAEPRRDGTASPPGS
jgi:gamma-glutamyltranspeptidase/glutathione hydrolase